MLDSIKAISPIPITNTKRSVTDYQGNEGEEKANYTLNYKGTAGSETTRSKSP